METGAAGQRPVRAGILDPDWSGPVSRRIYASLTIAVLLSLVLLGGGTTSARVLIDDTSDQVPGTASGFTDATPQVPAPPSNMDPAEIARWIDTEVLPIPQAPQAPLSELRRQGQVGWASFRAPLPAAPLWNPPGPKRVGLQAGHWEYADAPDELADLRSNPGTSGGGKAEWQVTLDIANRAAAMLRADGIEVDVLPTTIPVRYRANAFVAIHADGDGTGVLDGYKVARPGFSSVPAADDELVGAINDQYGAVTGLPREDNQISRRMTYYYAFNSRRYQHAVAPGVPQAIIETGFLTNADDRALLLGDPDVVARGIADGVLKFLDSDLEVGR